MSKHVVRGGDVAGLLTGFFLTAILSDTVRSFSFSGYWLTRVMIR